MDTSPKVSVVVPVYNAGERIIQSIESLLKQTLEDIEIILVNDSSTDGSGALIDRFARDNRNIVPVHLPENKGVHEARMAGLEKSTAPWIGFLDADDFARPNMFEVMHRTAVNQCVDIVVCGWQRVSVSRRIIPSLRLKASRKIESRVFERFCCMEFGAGVLWNKLYRRDVIMPCVDINFPWRQNINEDVLLNIGCFLSSGSVYCIRDVLYEYIDNPNSVTAKKDNYKAYVDTYRAFALAVHSYERFGADKLNMIVDLYRDQLSSRDCCIESGAGLLEHEVRLCEAIQLISKTNPTILAKISARSIPRRVSVAVGMRSIFYRFQSLFINRT